MRIAVLWTGLSGYLNACLRELADRPGVELFVAHLSVRSDAPFEESLFLWMKHRVVWNDASDYDLVHSKLAAFNPEVVVVAGWHVPIYRRLMKTLKGRCLRLMTMDNYWKGNLRQRLGTMVSAHYVKPMTDAAWVPGYHQAKFARQMGFAPDNILDHSLSCEQPVFAEIYQQRVKMGNPLPHAFLFVGRVVEEKGIRILADAYERYRRATENPWPLIVCGVGPLQSLLVEKPGILLKGFVQPADLPLQMAKAGCLLLPSIFEPWALVVNEATAAGLLIVATENVGAAPHLVHNYCNGYIVKAADPAKLAEVMIRVSNMDASRREKMSRTSHELSQQYTPARWADALLEFASSHKHGQPSGYPI